MLKQLSIFIIGILSWTIVPGQSPGKLWTGQVLDQETQAPIPFVHIVGADEGAISDAEGLFSIQVTVGDTVQFSHINYERYAVLIWIASERPVKVYLSRKENLMPEIVIRDYMPLDEFKQEIAKREAKHSVEEVNASYNMEFSTLLFRYGYTPEMNSLDNFKDYVRDPQEATLISSNPSRGLLRSLRVLRNQNGLFDRSQLKLNKTKNDSIRTERQRLPKK